MHQKVFWMKKNWGLCETSSCFVFLLCALLKQRHYEDCTNSWRLALPQSGLGVSGLGGTQRFNMHLSLGSWPLHLLRVPDSVYDSGWNRLGEVKLRLSVQRDSRSCLTLADFFSFCLFCVSSAGGPYQPLTNEAGSRVTGHRAEFRCQSSTPEIPLFILPISCWCHRCKKLALVHSEQWENVLVKHATPPH